MKNCTDIHKLIYPYLDGELERAENRMVEKHLLECPECNHILEEERRFLVMLENAALGERAPVGLEARITGVLEDPERYSLGGFWRRCFPKYAALAAFACGLLLLIFAGGIFTGSQPLPPFIEAGMASHRAYQHGKELTLVSDDITVVTAWMQEQLGTAPEFPRFDDRGVVLLGAGLEKYGPQEVVLLRYLVRGSPVTMLVARVGPETSVDTADYTHVSGRRINFSSREDLNVVSWTAYANNFALVSNLPHQGREGCVVCHARGSGLPDLSGFFAGGSSI